MDNLKETNKTIDIDTIIKRAEVAENNKKFTISVNHYYSLLSRNFNELVKNEDNFKNCKESFIFSIILLTNEQQKQRMINFILNNENLNLFEYKYFLEKL